MGSDQVGFVLSVAFGSILAVSSLHVGGCGGTVRRADGGTDAPDDVSDDFDSDDYDGYDGPDDLCGPPGDDGACPCGYGACGECLACEEECRTSADCGSNFHCAHPDGLCGDGAPGRCLENIVGDCGFTSARVCTCDGTVIPEDCPTVFGRDVALAKRCASSPFSCGDKTCTSFVQYCEIVDFGGGSEATCIDVPASCTSGISDCACVDRPDGSCQLDNGQQVVVSVVID